MEKTTTSRYGVAEHLRTAEDMAAYLEACLEAADGDAAVVAKAARRHRLRQGHVTGGARRWRIPRKSLQGPFGRAGAQLRHHSQSGGGPGSEAARRARYQLANFGLQEGRTGLRHRAWLAQHRAVGLIPQSVSGVGHGAPATVPAGWAMASRSIQPATSANRLILATIARRPLPRVGEMWRSRSRLAK